MSEGKELKKLSREILTKQIEESQKLINANRQNISQLQKQIEQQSGVMQYAEFLLAGFDIPAELSQEVK